MLNNLIRLSLLATLTYTFTSCHSGKTSKEPVGKDIFSMADSMAAVDSLRAALEQKANTGFPNYPLDISDSTVVKYPAAILTTGVFHEDEVSREDSSRNWYGIFRNSNGYYLDTTRVIAKRVQDPVDDEGTLNGWEVKTTNSDTSLLLIAGVNGLEKRQIKKVPLRKKQIMPGESETYTFNGITYTLYATGEKIKETDDNLDYIVHNYELFIRVAINGSERTQLLVSTREFDAAMTNILFAGDIDGDNIPDLIIDTSYHYNVFAPALYLSKPAGDKEVLKLMGKHVSVGC